MWTMALVFINTKKEKPNPDFSLHCNNHPPNAVFGTILPVIAITAITNEISSMTIHLIMLMYGKEASNRKQEIDRQHYTIPNQRPKDKHCGKI